MHGDTREFDEWLLRVLRHPGQPTVPIGPPWLMESARDLTVLGSHTILVVMLVLTVGYLALDRKYVAMWFVAVAASGGGLLSTAMKSLIGRERPAVVAHLVSVTSPSFPSGHAMLAAVVFLTLGALLARLRRAAEGPGLLPIGRTFARVPRRKQPGLLRRALSDGRAERMGGWSCVGAGLLARCPLPAISWQGRTSRAWLINEGASGGKRQAWMPKPFRKKRDAPLSAASSADTR